MKIFSSICFLLISTLCIAEWWDTWQPGDGLQWQGPTAGAASYCSTVSWNTFTNYHLDFQNTDGGNYACLESGNEIGTLVGSPTYVTPSPVSPVSGGAALFGDADNEYITFDNTNAWFTSQYGEFMFTMMIDGNNAQPYIVFGIEEITFQDYIRGTLNTVGTWNWNWEDNNSGGLSMLVTGFDIDAYYDNWIQWHFKWDTTQCTAGDGNCGSTNEWGIRFRIDTNSDLDFGDGGDEDWTAWQYETDTDDLEVWVAEPTTDDFDFGLKGTFSTANLYVDDIEFSTNQPADMGN